MLGKRRRSEIGPPNGPSLKAITTAIRGLVQWEAFRPISLGCTTWEATCGNGAKIGITLRSNTVCRAVRRGTVASPAACLLHVASTTPPIIVAIGSGFVVL
jgi:hypothetical protein